MKIPNYDVADDVLSNFKQLYDFMPNKCFRMLDLWSKWFRENKHTDAYDLQSYYILIKFISMLKI